MFVRLQDQSLIDVGQIAVLRPQIDYSNDDEEIIRSWVADIPGVLISVEVSLDDYPNVLAAIEKLKGVQ